MTELMDIGEHCAFCGQIDFLPFKCSCKQTFCKLHRAPEAHQCEFTTKPINREIIRTDHLPPSQSLFPDRSNITIPLKISQENTIIHNTKPSALNKLKKFFSNNKKSLKSNPTNPSKKLIELSKLKSIAKGDSKIPVSERIYLWVQVIDNENDKFDSIIKNPIFISRSWPIGRALDSIASELNLKNKNNRTTDQSQKLNLFKQDTEFVKLETSNRCSSLANGESLYIVRGEI